MKFYYATVIDNDDSNHLDKQKKSRIKVKIIPELKDVENSLLPWVSPFCGNGANSNNFSHNPPEINDNIWVFFMDEPYWKEGYYINGRIVKGLQDLTKWDLANPKILDKNSSTYPNPRFITLPDNSFIFWDTDTGDKGILQSNGTYLLFKGDGKIYVYSSDKETKIYSTSGNINVESLTGNVEVKATAGSISISGLTDVTLKAVGAAIWQPNALPACLFTGAPHGGIPLGITGLKGGTPS